MKTLNAETLHFPADERIVISLLLGKCRLMVIDENENALTVPHGRQPILETGLHCEIVHRLRGMVMNHRAVDARFDHVTGAHRRAGKVMPRK
jgi:hypothetical protein